MHAHFVLAHPEPRSFNAHLAASGAQALQAEGWTTTLSDLYAMGFDPCERPEHFTSRAPAERFDAQSEQRRASEAKKLPSAVADEIARLDRADLLVLQYPMWWHLPPAMLKGWFDRVFAYGEVYTSRKRWENGRYVGKRAMLSVTVGTSRETYAFDGRSGDIDLMLWPVNFTLAYVGYDVLTPFVAYGVEAGLRYSDPAEVEARLRGVVEGFRAELPLAMQRATLPFNRMAEWGADGRIVPGARSIRPSSGANSISTWNERPAGAAQREGVAQGRAAMSCARKRSMCDCSARVRSKSSQPFRSCVFQTGSSAKGDDQIPARRSSARRGRREPRRRRATTCGEASSASASASETRAGSRPFLTALEAKMSPKLGATTHRTPKSASA